MKSVLCLCALVTGLLTPSFAHHMAVVVNKNNKMQNLSSVQISKIFRAETKKWPDGKDIMLIFHKSSPDENLTIEKLTKMTSAELQSFLVSHKDSIRIVESDADVLDSVAAIPGAVGFVYERAIDDRINVVKIDGKLPMEAGYLSH